MAKNIRDEIVAKRQARVLEKGHAEGARVPARRETPIVPFMEADGLICEVKRRSPSRGDIAPGLDAVEQAAVYVGAGARNLSVLTEPEGFGGSLEDLMRVKRAFPDVAVLRKDFLFDVDDIDVSWRAGADAVLLIAGMLTEDRLAMLYRCARSLGLQALVEVHDAADLKKAAPLEPDLVGVNSRDLVSFAVDPLLPLRVKAGIGWRARVVYESGVRHPEQAAFAAAAGFSGLLVGEAVVRDPALAGRLAEAFRDARPSGFWTGVAGRLNAAAGRPLVKICGLTRADDAMLAADLGADILGFVFYDQSPRRASAELVRSLSRLGALKVAVTVNAADATALRDDVRLLLEDGLIDAVQLHGDERADACAQLWPVYFKALRPAGVDELAAADAYRCPRLGLDAWAEIPGGTGKRVQNTILDAWRRPLWLGGGVKPDNVARIAATRRPELVDIASGVEAEPGRKDPGKMRRLFEELTR